MTLDALKAALADRYTLERELGAGGMATVYLAQDLRHDRRVAIKVLRTALAAVIGAERAPTSSTTAGSRSRCSKLANAGCPAYIWNMGNLSPKSRALPAAVLARIESRAGEERMEWYAMGPEARWAASASLWATFVALGGTVDSDPDPARVVSLAESRSPLAADRRPGVHSVRRS